MGILSDNRICRICSVNKTHDANTPATFQSEKVEGFDFVESEPVAAYQKTYDRIFWDLDHAELELTGSYVDYANLIHAATHLRLVLERVITASFIASYTIFQEAQESVMTAKNFGEMRKKLKKLNSNYWPVAFGQMTHNGQTLLGVKPDVGVQESEVGRFWGQLSGILHAPNPFKVKTHSPDQDFVMLKDLVSQLKELLDSHIVQLADSSETFYLRRLPNRKIFFQVFRTETPLLRN